MVFFWVSVPCGRWTFCWFEGTSCVHLQGDF